MGKFVSEDAHRRIFGTISSVFGSTPRETFLRAELERYVPQFTGVSEEDIAQFFSYQRGIYIDGLAPEIGRPIASLNPTFVDDVKAISFSVPDAMVYTRASLKENGFRFQVHIGNGSASAFTRQFTSYDLRMFPELERTLWELPVMIGDAELVIRNHAHLAGFNRLEERIPGTQYWPRKGSSLVEDAVLAKYFANPFTFRDGWPLPDFELELAFHGLFAIADPATWGLPRAEQEKQLISLVSLPVDYRRVDGLLDLLGAYILKNSVPRARVVERIEVRDAAELERYVDEKFAAGLEGACVAQSVDNASEFIPGIGKTFKLKRYETVDAVLLGLYLKRKGRVTAANIAGGLLGLFDPGLGMYLPAFKVNFDPHGPQIKTAGQRQRLKDLRRELARLTSRRASETVEVPTLFDVYLRQGERILSAFTGMTGPHGEMLMSIPRGHDLVTLFDLHVAGPDAVGKKTAVGKFLGENRELFEKLAALAPGQLRRFRNYFSRMREVRQVSAKMPKPQRKLSLRKPILMEAQVFDVKWNLCPFPAGFHSWYVNSIQFQNVFAERIRNDKDVTTDLTTVHAMARSNTPKPQKGRRKKVS